MLIAETSVGVECLFGTPTAREQALQRFLTRPSSHVLLISMRTAGSGCAGLTLTAASHAFLMEPVLNFGLEAQAIGRINRIGQTVQPVVERLLIADSIEYKVRQMSIRKQHLQSKAQVAESEQLKEKEVLELFGI